MHASISLWLTTVLCTAVAMAQDKDQPKASAPTSLKVGDQVPPGTKLATLDGKEFTFKEVRGKTVVVHFWSISCPWEKVAEPKLIKLASDHQDKDVVTLAIDANQKEIGTRPEPAAFTAKDKKDLPYGELRRKAEKVGLNHPVLVDHDGVLARLLAARSNVHCFVIDGQGTLVYSGALDDDGQGAIGEGAKHYVRMAVDAVRAGKKVETPTTTPYGCGLDLPRAADNGKKGEGKD